MREWPKRTVCKTDGRNPLVGSNPTLVTFYLYAQVVERYTRDTQNVVLARGCGFESHLGHKNLTHGVVVSRQILALETEVRLLLGQHNGDVVEW